MELFSEGRGAVACLTDEALKELSASPDDGEGAVEMLRDIKGVELAAFLKEKEEGVRVSMRAKSRGGVSEIASQIRRRRAMPRLPDALFKCIWRRPGMLL